MTIALDSVAGYAASPASMSSTTIASAPGKRWEFANSPQFELILTPSVLVELDELKINHRNADVRDKAEGLITRIVRG